MNKITGPEIVDKNVIRLFSRSHKEDVSIIHPGSKHFPKIKKIPLISKEDTFQPLDYKADPVQMLEVIEVKVSKIKELSTRLHYYLSQL